MHALMLLLHEFLKKRLSQMQEKGVRLLITLDDVAGGMLRPHLFCKPIAKRPETKPCNRSRAPCPSNRAARRGRAMGAKIAPGFTADMVLLDDDFNTCKVFIDGVEKYSA